MDMISYIKNFKITLREFGGREYPEDFVTSNVEIMRSWGFENVLVWLLDNEFHIDTFMRRFPEVWKDFKKRNWENILLRTNRPHNLRLWMDERGNFDDIIFLYKYIEVDSLKWAYEHPLLPISNKLAIFEYLLIRPQFLFKDYGDSVYFENGADEKLEYYLTTRELLFDDGLVKVPRILKEDEALFDEACGKIEVQLKQYITVLGGSVENAMKLVG